MVVCLLNHSLWWTRHGFYKFVVFFNKQVNFQCRIFNSTLNQRLSFNYFSKPKFQPFFNVESTLKFQLNLFSASFTFRWKLNLFQRWKFNMVFFHISFFSRLYVNLHFIKKNQTNYSRFMVKISLEQVEIFFFNFSTLNCMPRSWWKREKNKFNIACVCWETLSVRNVINQKLHQSQKKNRLAVAVQKWKKCCQFKVSSIRRVITVWKHIISPKT